MCDCGKGCLTPDEVQNLRDDLASAERERAHQHRRADQAALGHAREADRADRSEFLHKQEIEALQARVAELERLLGLADSWITAALECKEWRWDADQHEAATHTRDELRAELEGKKE
jgi:hypothetical protein